MKVLVIYATAGAGHRKAAEAVYNGLKEMTNHRDPLVTLVDSLDYTSPFYKTLYSGTYTFLITQVPWLWGIIFVLIDIRWLGWLVNCMRRFQNYLNGRLLVRFLEKEQFDCIISTHFFPNEVAAHLKKSKKISSRIISVITDYDVHTIWLADTIDKYTVATNWTKEKLKSLGVSEDKIAVTGIPTDAKFSKPRDVAGLKQKLGLQPNVFTALIATGSFGIGPIGEIVEAVGDDADIQIIVVCGHNKDLYARLKQKEKGLVKIFGLVNNMDELMAVSDVMVTKPGGLSISEALVVGLPMIFFNAIPGQETNNIKVLKQSGVGLSDCSVAEIAQALKQFSSSPADLQAAKEKAKALGKPSAVKDIISLIK
jgi:processive 1,2-diacylglycerol beta-glucosyltransferase